jgi:hypothetical protein
LTSIPWKSIEAPPQADARRGTRSGKLPTLYFVQNGPALKTLIDTLLRQALSALPADVVPATLHAAPIEIERTRDPQHGDFASNLAMQLAKATRQNPRKIAQALVAALPADPAIAKVEIAGAGFINFFLKDDAYHTELGKMLSAGRGLRPLAIRRRSFRAGGVRLRQPHGPAARRPRPARRLRRLLANLLEAAGYRVTREYYINDAGRQMDILAVSTWLRYLEHCGEQFTFPANAYVGDYIAPIAARLFAARAMPSSTPPPRCSRICPGRTPGWRQGRLHRCRHPTRARTDRRRWVPPGIEVLARRHLGGHSRGPHRIPRHLRFLVLRALV